MVRKGNCYFPKNSYTENTTNFTTAFTSYNNDSSFYIPWLSSSQLELKKWIVSMKPSQPSSLFLKY